MGFGPTPPPSVSAGCGYKATVSGNSVTIRPTTNQGVCNITIGLGDATFVFDPTNPPDTLTRLIDGDSDGSFAPLISFNAGRVTKIFSSSTTHSETFTDADGEVTQVEALLLDEYEEIPSGEREYVASGFYNILRGRGRIMW